MMKTNTEKFDTVISKNTFYFFENEFEKGYDSYIDSIRDILILLKNEVDKANGVEKKFIEDILLKKENGLVAILALCGLSNENLKRITTLIRVTNDDELNKLVLKDQWNITDGDKIIEWSDSKISGYFRKNESFRKGMVNLFFEGSTIPFLTKTIPPFELKKLKLSKFKFELNELLDTIVRYKEKGSYSGNKGNNAEIAIESILKKLNINWATGDLKELVGADVNIKRTMDFIIPSKDNPKIIIESSFLATTSSGQGDKAKTEIQVRDLIFRQHPECLFIGFVDGIGWYVRTGDLSRMVEAYHDVFTFHQDELIRFENLLNQTFNS